VGPEQDPARTDRRRHGAPGHDLVGVAAAGELRQTEVDDLHEPVVAHHDVLGLDIAVHDAGGVRFCQALGHLERQVDDTPHRQRRPVDRRQSQTPDPCP
jgi:hypothetical protein